MMTATLDRMDNWIYTISLTHEPEKLPLRGKTQVSVSVSDTKTTLNLSYITDQ